MKMIYRLRTPNNVNLDWLRNFMEHEKKNILHFSVIGIFKKKITFSIISSKNNFAKI